MATVINEQIIRKIVEESLKDIILNENNDTESFKGLAAAGLLGAASLFGGNNANAQTNNTEYSYRTPDSVRYQDARTRKDSIMADKIWDREDYVTNHPVSIEELSKLFPNAYKDKDKTPEEWKNNQMSYVGMINGKNSIVGKVAASNGQNPWNALVNKYTSNNYNSKTNNQ